VLKQVIRSVAFEESEANRRRTISLDSSTTVDEISIMTSLHNSVFKFATRVLAESGTRLTGP